MNPTLNDAPDWRSRFLLPDGSVPRMAGGQDPEGEAVETTAEPENAETSAEAPAPEGEAPDTQETPEPAVEAGDEIDWESLTPEELRAGYLRHADYTRKTQEAAPFRKLAEELGVTDPADREALFQALGEKLGYEITAEEAEEEAEAEEAPAEVEAVEDEPEAIEADEPDPEVDRFASLDEELTGIETELGRPVTEQEIELLGALGTLREDGSVDLRAGFEQIQRFRTAEQLAWQESKGSAPAVIPEGGSGDPAPDLSTPEGREARMAEVMAAANANA